MNIFRQMIEKQEVLNLIRAMLEVIDEDADYTEQCINAILNAVNRIPAVDLISGKNTVILDNAEEFIKRMDGRDA